MRVRRESPEREREMEMTLDSTQIPNHFVMNQRDDSDKILMYNATFAKWEDIQKEDVDIIQGMQIGRNSNVYNGGNFSPVMDNPTHHFHKWVATNIAQ